jgi:hypothetical protein
MAFFFLAPQRGERIEVRGFSELLFCSGAL